jgi:membrane fusion protein, multidrug efflux system
VAAQGAENRTDPAQDRVNSSQPDQAARLTVAALTAGVVASMLVSCSGNATPGAGAAPPRVQSAATAKQGAAARRPGGPIAVVVRQVETVDFVDSTEALGTAKANEAVDITAKATNRVVALHIREGQFVRQGDVLVEFDGIEARANLAAAEALARDSQSLYQRSKQLFQIKALSESDMVQAEARMLNSKSSVEAAQARVNDTVIRAPFGGRVGLRNVSVGSLVTPGQVITTLDDISVIKLDFSVPESFLSTVHEGDVLDAATSAWPEQVFSGRISSIATRVDPVSRSIMVRALIDNRAQRLKPGMFMTVKVQRSSGKALLIPEQALLPDGDNQFVYVVHDGIAHRIQVQLGRRRPGEVEARQGLQAGDTIVIAGGEKLHDGAQIVARAAEAA